MKKIDYLKLAISLKLYEKKKWVVSAFSITKPKEVKENYPGKIIAESWGYSFVDAGGEIQKIDDCDPALPLFRFKDKVTVDNTWMANVPAPIETTLGNLLFNVVCVLSSFGPKMPYQQGRVSVDGIEELVAPLLKDTPTKEADRSNEYYYVDEYVKFVDALQYLSTFSQLCTWSATRRSILPPTGVQDFKAALNVKYEGRLTDPVELAKYESELLAFDEKYLEGDPANGTFVKGKIKNTARKQLFLNIGAEGGFTQSLSVVPVINSLDQGWPTEPTQFTSMMNGGRFASYSRGAETVKGGVSAKYLLRAANNFSIKDVDCGTKLGIRRLYTQSGLDGLVGRYVIEGGKSVFVENINGAGNYLNKPVIVRSPMYCKLPGDTICKVCAGARLSQFPTGVTIPLTEISGIILTASLKLMHKTSVTTAKLSIKSAFS